MVTTFEEARGVQPKVATEVRRLTGLWPTAVGVKRFSAGGWGFKVNIAGHPESGLSLPDHLFGIPVEFEVRGAAVLLSQAEFGVDAAE
mgnify:CR=1 FL=1